MDEYNANDNFICWRIFKKLIHIVVFFLSPFFQILAWSAEDNRWGTQEHA